MASDSPDLSTLPESLRVLSLIWSLDAALARTSQSMESKLGVSGQQRFLLRFIGLAPGITRDRLALVVFREAAALQFDLDSLVAKNLLTQSLGNDGYHLTGQGATVNGVTAGTVEHAVSKALDEGSPMERTAFRQMLDRVLRQLSLQA